MSRFGTQYHVARQTGVCAATGEPIAPGSACIATLCEREGSDELVRLDFGLAAWEAGARPEGLFSFWRTTSQPPQAKRRVFVDDEVLLDLFHRLEGDDRPQRAAFRFVLGLVLLRKRLLRFEGRSTSWGAAGAGSASAGSAAPERWLLRPRGADPSDPPIELVNPRLGDDDVRDITAQLGEILDGEL
jgi:hypothetical protein